ncbi:Transcription factor atf-7 [Caenorhabditis elegans]|uniref:Isoform a of Transcription factor atf-7 n=1 Tax=Caenorhabditis elegans TaxID=6239 RepID=Q86MD3-3|nr:Transcription factor atf-7 [Caenorhabditis elegans]CAB63430.2 Transcription factor atf-7 [Caenorhabditis elegans]|eukprot:NP_497914.2 ATF (cAMP-dependent transcription factor) family [Caenorhabditis elegans]
MSVVTTTSMQSDSKKRVQLMGDTTSPFSLDTPNPKLMFTPLDLPTTAELMQRCLAVNPFEAKFREANQKISSGSMQPNTSGANQSLEALEANGGSQFSGSNAGTMSDLLLKIPQASLQHSPGIFSNMLLNAGDSEGTTRENLKTADISKLLSVAGDFSAQAPRTADVLNAVLDMHSDRLHTINYLNNKPDFSALLRSPSSSAPNSASVLTNAMAIPSTSGAPFPGTTLLVPPKTVSSYHSPLGASSQPPSTQKSPADGSWDHINGEKQIKKEIPYFNDDAMMLMERSNMSSSGSDQDQSADMSNAGSTASTSTGNPVGRPQNGTPGRGRGRGRSTTADMQPDERRNTILERNKAAAVRYRKRKKEEHDDMMGRVQAMEAEKNQLLTQNQVLRRELERVTALLTERESRCVCLKGVPMSDEQHADHHHRNTNGMYSGSDMLNGLGQINGMQLKLPKLQ